MAQPKKYFQLPLGLLGLLGLGQTTARKKTLAKTPRLSPY
jgi:hypothetical protein